jgi:hypothetical protein
MKYALACVGMIAACGFVLSPPANAQTMPSADDAATMTTAQVISAFGASVRYPTTYSVYLTVKLDFLHRAVPGGPESEIDRYKMLRDGEKIDMSLQGAMYSPPAPAGTPAITWRTMWNGNQFLHRQQIGGDARGRGGVISLCVSGRREDALAGPNVFGPFIDGRLYLDDRPMAAILAGAATVTRQHELMDGRAYTIMGVQTGDGKYTVWLDEQHGFMLRKAVVEKKSGDRFAGRTLPDPDGPLAVASYSASIDNIEIAPEGKYTLPISGTMMETCRYKDGSYTQIRTTYTRSQIRPDRTFTGTDAFVMTNVPAGQPVNRLDAGATDSTAYVWANGQAVASTMPTTRAAEPILRLGMSLEPRERENQ